MSVPFDQVSYLFLCVKYATGGGKIDFPGVSKEYQQVHGPGLSPEAARKRYMRLKARLEGTQIASDRSPKKRGKGEEGGAEGVGSSDRRRKRCKVESEGDSE
jgi:hypothetical protein